MRKAISDCVEEILSNPQGCDTFAGHPNYYSENFSCSEELGIFFTFTRLTLGNERVKLTGREENAIYRAMCVGLEFNKLCALVRLQRDL